MLKIKVMALMAVLISAVGVALAEETGGVPEWAAKRPFDWKNPDQIRRFIRCDHPEVTLNARVQATYLDTLPTPSGLTAGEAAFGNARIRQWNYQTPLAVDGVQVRGFMRHPAAIEAFTLVMNASIDELVVKELVSPDALRQCEPLLDRAGKPSKSRVCGQSVPLDTSHLTEAPFGPREKLNALLMLMEGPDFVPTPGQTLLACTLMPREGNPFR